MVTFSSAMPTAWPPTTRTALDLTAASLPVISSMPVVARARRSSRRIPSGPRIRPAGCAPSRAPGTRRTAAEGSHSRNTPAAAAPVRGDEQARAVAAGSDALGAEAVAFTVGQGPFTGGEDADG